jgi:hypothetical protein
MSGFAMWLWSKYQDADSESLQTKASVLGQVFFVVPFFFVRSFCPLVVLREAPFFVAPPFSDDSAADVFACASDKVLEKLLSLSGQGLLQKAKRNGVKIGDNLGGLFERFSRFNHSCDPNCEFLFADGEMVVTCVKRVNAGEELCICYRPNDETSSFGRKLFLLQKFGFVCDCIVCINE